jgi:16S rRNA (adenine1518-N6/adenine1519-N6)-dimethyltransferase
MGGEIQNRSEIRRLLSDHDHRPDSRYGQNFLADPEIVNRIVTLAQVEDRNVVEIGAGTGTLTYGLCAVAAKVVSYEIDETLASIVAEGGSRFANLELKNADASAVRFDDALGGSDWVLVANLPYNVGTGIVLDALRHAPNISRFVVMVQSEVADRLLAGPGSRTYGLPSVITGLHADGSAPLRVPPNAFEPQPRVDSTVVVLERLDPPKHSERAIAIAAAGFGQRRKMLRGSLKMILENPAALLARAGIDPTLRAEDLGPLDFVSIAAAEDA